MEHSQDDPPVGLAWLGQPRHVHEVLKGDCIACPSRLDSPPALLILSLERKLREVGLDLVQSEFAASLCRF